MLSLLIYLSFNFVIFNYMQMSMIINESLRLYLPVVSLTRESLKEVRLGQVVVPANVELHVTNLHFTVNLNIGEKTCNFSNRRDSQKGLRKLLTTTQLHSCFTGREDAAKEMHVINDKQASIIIFLLLL